MSINETIGSNLPEASDADLSRTQQLNNKLLQVLSNENILMLSKAKEAYLRNAAVNKKQTKTLSQSVYKTESL